MKRYKFLIANWGMVLIVLLVSACYDNDTNLNYATLDLPVLENPNNDPALFIENNIYKIKLHDRLEICPNVVYQDMGDLSYKWIINGKVYSTEKDLDWICEMKESKVHCVYEVHRNSAGNSQVFPFTIQLDEPYIAGFSLLVEEGGGTLRHDFISYEMGQPYRYLYHRDASHKLFPFVGDHPRLKEYWSCESRSVVGEQLFLDSDPENCFSFNGRTLSATLSLKEEFINEKLPQDFRIKDFMDGGYVSYLLAEDGRIFQRHGASVYYTGHFMDLPLQYEGKQIKGKKFVSTRYEESYGLIYDETEGSGRFLIVNFDYNVTSGYKPAKAGAISEFPSSAGMSGITDYDFVDGYYVHNSDPMDWEGSSKILLLFRKKSDQKYYIRELGIRYSSKTSDVEEVEDVYDEKYRELKDFGPESVICVIRTSGEGMVSPPVSYIYYTSASDNSKVLCTKHEASYSPSAEFHIFPSKVVAIDHETYSRQSCMLLFATADNKAMIYAIRSNHLSPMENQEKFERERVIDQFQIDGVIRWAGCKYGNIDKYQ